MSEESVTDLVRRLDLKGPSALKQLRTMIGRLLDRHHVAAALFLDVNGELKPDAKRWFAELARRNYVNGGCFDKDPREHAFREGRRELAQEIIASARLDAGRLEALTKLEREIT
jgi:hypothetical protein